MLKVKNICYSYKNKKEVLKNITFSAKKGQITTILGPNGSGKTTLFKCISGLLPDYKGEVEFDGKLINNLDFKERAKIFSVVPQEHTPPFAYLVFDVVLMGRANYIGIFSTPKKEDYKIAEEALEFVGIKHLKDIPYTEISGGERQLVLIARALAQKAPVMLLDEPVNHLDFRNQLEVLKKIKEIAKDRNITVIMTLHDPNLACLFSDYAVIVNSGKKIAEGKTSEILTEELIKKLYKVRVKIYSLNGHRIICPLI